MKNQNGFTLMELIVAIAIVGILALVAYTVIYFNFGVVNSVMNSTNSRWDIREILSMMRNEIQNMQPTSPGNSDHENENGNGNGDDHGNGHNDDEGEDEEHGNSGDNGGSDNSADIFNQNQLRFSTMDNVQITYQIQGNSEIRKRLNREAWTTVISDLESASFSYYDANMNETNSRNDIRFIRINLVANVNGNSSAIEETIYVRNENSAQSAGGNDDHDSDHDNHSGGNRD